MNELSKLLNKVETLHQSIVDDVPELKAGRVYCRVCKHKEQVNSAECLRLGWPKCCGQTMMLGDLDATASQQKDKE